MVWYVLLRSTVMVETCREVRRVRACAVAVKTARTAARSAIVESSDRDVLRNVAGELSS